LGKEIYKLKDEVMVAGDHEVFFNSSDYPEGIYFCQLISGNYTGVIKLNKVF
jgi:hypothetical protein